MRSEKIDILYNKTVIDIFLYSGVGYVTGFALSIFFKNKSASRSIMTGLGCGYGFSSNKQAI